MSGELTVRKAVMADWEILLEWKNDPETRKSSHDPIVVEAEAHKQWLEANLDKPDSSLLIIELTEGEPVGTVRIDKEENDLSLLSWTVSPSARGRGYGKEMVKLVAESIPGQVRAEVKSGNMASVKIAESAGMYQKREEDGVLYFYRD